MRHGQRRKLTKRLCITTTTSACVRLRARVLDADIMSLALATVCDAMIVRDATSLLCLFCRYDADVTAKSRFTRLMRALRQRAIGRDTSGLNGEGASVGACADGL